MPWPAASLHHLLPLLPVTRKVLDNVVPLLLNPVSSCYQQPCTAPLIPQPVTGAAGCRPSWQSEAADSLSPAATAVFLQYGYQRCNRGLWWVAHWF